MGVDDMDPGLRQLYLQKPYVKATKKASLLATIFEEPVQKTKSKEPQLMAARGFKRFLDFESQTEFAKRRRKREQRAYSHQMQKQREQMAQDEPDTQVNNCGRPKRRAATLSEAATKVMTFFDSPPKPISKESFEFSLASISNKYQQPSSVTKDISLSSSSSSSSGGGGGGGSGSNNNNNNNNNKSNIIMNNSNIIINNSSNNSSRDKPRRRIAKPLRISKEIQEIVSDLSDVAASVNDLVTVVEGNGDKCLSKNLDTDEGGGGGGGGGCSSGAYYVNDNNNDNVNNVNVNNVNVNNDNNNNDDNEDTDTDDDNDGED